MNDILKVKNKKFLEALPNHEEGEIAFCEDENIYMMYKDDAWIQVKAEMTEQGLQLNLYDLNKQIISQMPSFDEAKIQEVITAINEWENSGMYMLYGRELNYFTLLQKDEQGIEPLGETVMELLLELSDYIYAVDIVNDSAIEIWIKYEEEPTTLYLFNYKDGVVYYG